jgi:CP family cyanate transporter-like MFS transporter
MTMTRADRARALDATRRPATAVAGERAGRGGNHAGTTGFAVLVLGVMVVCLNLRPAVTGVPPIFGQLQRQLGLSSTEITVLATLPVLCFGLFSPLAALAGRRWGEERAVLLALSAATVGLAARASFPGALLLAGTVVTGGAIAMLNVLLPGLIKRRAPHRSGMLLSLYMVMLYIGAIGTSACVVPIYSATHGSVPVSLGFVVAPMAVALLAWLPQARYGAPTRRQSGARSALPRGHVRRHALAWQVTAFMGLQSLTYYATLSFLPGLYLSRGMAAGHTGLVGSLLSVGGLVSAFGVPLIAHRSASVARWLLVAAVVFCGIGIAAALLAPVGVGLGLVLLLGLGQGAAIALALSFVMARAASPAVAASLSALAQGVGYVVAALGPLAVGLLHTATGGWGVPVLVLLVATVAELVFGLLAVRPRQVPAPSDGSSAAPAPGSPVAGSSAAGLPG